MVLNTERTIGPLFAKVKIILSFKIKMQHEAQKQRTTNSSFNPRIPISEIVKFCGAKEREIAKLFSKTWKEEELRSRPRFFFTMCSEDPELPHQEFHSTIDYRERYIQLQTDRHKKLPVEFSMGSNKALEKFNAEYTVSLVGLFEDPIEGLTQLFQETVIAMVQNGPHNGRALCFDLEFDEDVVVHPLSTSCSLQIWIRRDSDCKMALFGTHTNIFATFEGFEPDGQLSEIGYDRDELGFGHEFHGGYGSWYSREEYHEGEEEYKWFEPVKGYEFGTDSFEYAFRAPEPQEILVVDEELNEDEQDDANDAAYEKWSETQRELPRHLRRLKLVYNQRKFDPEPQHHYMYADPPEPQPFKPCKLFSVFTPNVRWI